MPTFRQPSLPAVLLALALLLVGCGSAEYVGSYGPRTAHGAGVQATAMADTEGLALAEGAESAPAARAPSALSVDANAVEEAQAPAAPPPGSPPSGAAGEASKPADPAAEPPRARELVIYTARFVMAVFQVEQGLAAVEKITEANGGYVALRRDREIVVRVPRGRFDAIVAGMDEVGDVLHREIRAEDVTEAHVDLEIRIKNARAMQKRLSELLSRASVKEALEIEKQLRRVTEELELLEGRLKLLRDRIAFSTITVQFQPRGARIPSARVRLPFPWLPSVNLATLLSLTEEK